MKDNSSGFRRRASGERLSFSGQSLDTKWKIERPYRAPLRFSDLSDEGGLCKAQVDFGQLLSTAGVRGTIDPRSIVLAVRNAQSGEMGQIPCRVSEMLCYEDRGEIHWTADRAHKDGSWWLYFDVIGEECYAPSYAANVGFGDELMLNCDGPAPLEVPLHASPLSIDLSVTHKFRSFCFS